MEENIKHPGDFTGLIKEVLSLKDVKANDFSPLVLAYIGDAIYELIIRTKVINHGSMQVSKMHQKSASLVKAGTQADMLKIIEKDLTQEERSIYRRGRNAKAVTVARNAAMIDYRMATGFEALIGYLYLIGRHDRLLFLVRTGLEGINEL